MLKNITVLLRHHRAHSAPSTLSRGESTSRLSRVPGDTLGTSPSPALSVSACVLAGACDCERDPAGADFSEAPPAAQPV